MDAKLVGFRSEKDGFVRTGGGKWEPGIKKKEWMGLGENGLECSVRDAEQEGSGPD